MALDRRNSLSPKKQRRKPSRSSPPVPPLSSQLTVLPSIPACSPHHLYVPQLHRQQTTVASLSPVGMALATLAATDLDDDLNSGPGLAARQSLNAIMDSIHLGLSRGLVGLKYSKFILAKTFTHWQVRPEKRVTCFLPVEIKGAVLCPRGSGSCCVQLSEVTDSEDSPLKFSSLGYVSSKKVYGVLKKLLVRSLLSKEIPEGRLNFSSTERKLEIVLHDVGSWVAEIVPCLKIKGSSTLFCCRAFYDAYSVGVPNSETADDSPSTPSTPRSTTIDEIRVDSSAFVMSEHGSNVSNSVFSPLQELSEPLSPVLDLSTLDEEAWPTETKRNVIWYACVPRSENRLVKNINRTDNGVRMSAMRVVHKICQADWRLRDVSIYDVQTAMLHDADHQLDHSPRWQRETLEQCTRAILAKLGEFAHARYLPHFLVQEVNLWAHIPAKRFSLMSGAIDRLTSNDVAFVSLVRRAGQFNFPPGVHIYSDFLTPSPRQVGKRQQDNEPNRDVENSLKKGVEKHKLSGVFCKVTEQSDACSCSKNSQVKYPALATQKNSLSLELRNVNNEGLKQLHGWSPTRSHVMPKWLGEHGRGTE